MIRFTKQQWDSFPKDKKGRIGSEYAANGLGKRFLGNTTLKSGKRVLFEGIDYVIVGGDDLV